MSGTGNQTPGLVVDPAVDLQKIKAGDTLVCECCGIVFTTQLSSEQAEPEYQEAFPMEAAADEERSVVCGPCYQKFMAWWNEQ